VRYFIQVRATADACLDPCPLRPDEDQEAHEATRWRPDVIFSRFRAAGKTPGDD